MTAQEHFKRARWLTATALLLKSIALQEEKLFPGSQFAADARQRVGFYTERAVYEVAMAVQSLASEQVCAVIAHTSSTV